MCLLGRHTYNRLHPRRDEKEVAGGRFWILFLVVLAKDGPV